MLAGATAGSGDETDELAFWTSADGIRWTRLPDRPAFVPATLGETIRLRHVAWADPGYVAVGESGPKAIILASPDGLEWSSMPVAPEMARITIEGIAGSGGQFIMVGHARNPYRAAIWRSVDGAAWSELPTPVGFRPSQYSAIQIAGGSSGWLVAAPGEGPYAQRLWWSADGRAWSSTGPSSGGLVLYPGQLAAASWGFVATTGGSNCVSDVWTSPDGRSWECSSGPPADASWDPDWRFAAGEEAIVAYRPFGRLWVAPLGD